MVRNKRKNLFNNLIQSYLSSLISITLVLLMIGAGSVIGINLHNLSKYLRENIKISVFFNDKTDMNTISEITQNLKKERYTKKIVFISKEQGAKEMSELLGGEFLSVFENNPIPNSIEIYPIADYVVKDSIVIIRDSLESIEGVREVVYQENLVEKIGNNARKITIVFFSIAGVLLFISLVLISNTVRLSILSQKESIQTMKIVGAKLSYIKKPYMKIGFYLGLVSSLISSVLLTSFLIWIEKEYGELLPSLINEGSIYALVLVAIIGVFITTTTANSVVTKILKKRIKD